MAKRKRTYNTHSRQREQLRTVPDFATYTTGVGMPATLIAQGFRIETRGGKQVLVTEQRYMLR